MNIKNILSATALFGALATASVASADHDRHDERDRDSYREARLDVIGTARLSNNRGVATFTLTPGERRDGLQLATDGSLRIQSVDLEYSDGRIERLRGPNLRTALIEAPVVTIQQGRPPGLRKVTVRYAMTARDRVARLQLIQLHTGDGYTRDQDIYRGNRKFDSHDIDAPYVRGRNSDDEYVYRDGHYQRRRR